MLQNIKKVKISDKNQHYLLMSNSNLPEPELLKALLGPLLEDFQYWFAQALLRLETEQQSLSHQEFDLLERLQQAQGEVSAAQSLFQVTKGQIGIDTSVLMLWHQLVTECWRVTISARLGPAQLGLPESEQKL